MTVYFNNVYINDSVNVSGPFEANGPLSNYFNYSFSKLNLNKSYELSEIDLINKAYSILNKKSDLFISGDLSNQITCSSYFAKNINVPFIGIYSACSTSVLGLILSSIFIENNFANSVITSTSSHNNMAEKQFRNPVEYGSVKKKTSTFTSTGCGMCFISNEKSNIKIESGTIGRAIDSKIDDSNHMGAVMALSAVKTLEEHLMDTKRDVNYYDLILTGDLGLYGMKIFKETLKNDNINIVNYNDCGVMLYDLEKQNVNAGASGPACLPLVCYNYIFNKIRNKELKHVLLIGTGALHSKEMVNQKNGIPSISHVISLEAL